MNGYDNNKTLGDAIFETSSSKGAYNSWNDEISFYMSTESGFILRSGSYDIGKRSGIFAFEHHSGHDYLNYTFRATLIKK